MDINKITTLGALKAAGYQSKNIQEELRSNLIEKLKKAEDTFSGIIGYENTVIPQLHSAILSKHHINLLGLRGQAKTRIARSLISLLDEWMPIVAGSEINDDPLQPLSKYAQKKIAEQGDDTPVSWVHREDRFFEKLATPDVTVADLIGDVDPIKAANLRLSYGDEEVIHYGMIPRANRCLFVINELPDLQARIQVALFNILQEGDIQIRGFQVRIPLDIQFIFTANPEDYTNRGSIVTPLKDRIGSQILTHYPKNVAIAKSITKQEAKVPKDLEEAIYIPELARDLLEQIGFEARRSDFIDVKSGVSARLSITAFENLISTASLRMLQNGDNKTGIRMSDFMGIIPAITGKVELVYEGEQEGAENVALQLIGNAIKTQFATIFREIKKLSKPGDYDEFDAILQWFMKNKSFELTQDMPESLYHDAIDQIEALEDVMQKYQANLPKEESYFYKEFLLWGLVEYKKLDKNQFERGLSFDDVLFRN